MAHAPKIPKFLRRALLTLGVLAFVGLLSFLFHRPLLHAAARAWIANDTVLEKVDAAIIPGGGNATRPFGAAGLYHKGLADRLVVFRVELSPAQEMGIAPSEHEITLKILEELEVPPADVVLIGDSVTSTWDEVEATRAWCEANQIRSIAVFTEIFPSRRVAWAYRRGLRHSDTAIQVVALDPARYQANNWWTEEEGLISFQNEFIKHLFYRLKY